MGSRVRVFDVFRIFYNASTWFSTLVMLLVIGFAVGEIIIGNFSGLYPSKFFFYITQMQTKEFGNALSIYVAILFGQITVITIKLWLSDRLSIKFRKCLVQKIHKNYLSGNSFYDLLLYDTHIDNPDGRISNDIENYGETAIKIIVTAAQAPATIIWYSYTTYNDMGGKTLLITFAFTFATFTITRLAMHPIIALTYKFEAANADFRLAHVNLKENAETIALSRAQSAEQQLLSNRLASVLKVQKQLCNTSIFLNIVVNICQYFGNALVYWCIYLSAPATTDPAELAIARVFVQRPYFALLDEATSAIPSKLEEEVFQVLADRGVTCITIAHNRELSKWHKKTLELIGDGSYKIY